ncbi:MAG: flagellar assembly protein FliW [Verrucomicrobia bacterium]|nr:flagellar assembly protein FliW [Verrucomicrobiota bacterium]
MKCDSLHEPEPLAGHNEAARLDLTLLGFERTRNYTLSARADEAPFCWLEVADQPGLAFLVIEPFVVEPDYKPNINDRDTQVLGLQKPEDAVLLNIVTLRGANQATVNLKGPIVVNRHTRVGKQVIPDNASDYSIQHPLPVGN